MTTLKAIAASMTPGEKPLGGGLYLRHQGGEPRLVVRYPWQGKTKRFQLGTLARNPDLEKAHEKARQIIRMAREGTDPQEERVVIPTFGEHATAFMDRHLPTLKNENHRDKWRGSLANHCKPIWDKRVDEIEVRHVLTVLDPIWKKIPVMASEVRSRIEMVLGDAEARGMRKGVNPAQWSRPMMQALGGRPPKRGATRGAMASVPFEDMPGLIADLDSRKNQTARALICIAATCVRTQEFLGMRLSELDLDAELPTWTIPYERFKVDPHKQNYMLPLAPLAVRVLKEQIADLEAVFGEGAVDYLWPASFKGRKAGAEAVTHISDVTMLRYLQRTMGLKATVHGFRASFKTWSDDQVMAGAEVTPKYPPHAVEFCLAHAPGGKVEQAYRRGMMFRARVVIMRDWAAYLAPEPANVVKLRRGRAA